MIWIFFLLISDISKLVSKNKRELSLRQDKEEKYDPYLIVKVPFKENRYLIDVCNKDSSVCSVTNIYNFTDMQCDIYIDKIWKFNEQYICKWKVRKILLI